VGRARKIGQQFGVAELSRVWRKEDAKKGGRDRMKRGDTPPILEGDTEDGDVRKETG